LLKIIPYSITIKQDYPNNVKPAKILKIMSKKEEKPTKETEKFIRIRYWRLVKNKKLFFLSPALYLTGYLASTTVAPVFYSGFIQDATLGNYSNFSSMIPAVLIIASLYLVKSICTFLETRVYSRVVEYGQYTLALEAYEKISSMPKSFFADRFTGALVGQVGPYSGRFANFLSQWIYTLLPSVISSVLMLAYIGTKSLWLAFPLVLSSAVYAIIILKNRRRMRELNRNALDAGNVYSGKIADSLSSIEVVKAEGAEAQELLTLSPDAKKFTRLRRISENFNNTQGELVNFLNQFFILISIVFSVFLYIGGHIDLATVILMSSYASSIIGNVAAISRFKLNLQEIYAATQPISEIMMMEPEIKDPENPVNLIITDGQIEFNKASFKYTNSSEEVKDEDETTAQEKNKIEEQHLFKDLDLLIQPGEKIGLVGPSGGGKSTLLKLILRFYDVDSGEVKIDGVSVKNVIQSKLRQQIAYVPQDPALFHRSIGENIGYSKPDAKQKDIELAAKQAYVDEFIKTLPDGYDTLVGERGVKLSGGQRQRVAIARAILKDAPILLLDEATSALDSESESYIQRSLEKLMKDRTTVVVAHRLSTIRKMDRIIVIDNGRVVDSGPHEELLKTSALYKKLWSHQSGGILQD